MTTVPPPINVLHREVQVETPEQVAVGYELADLGSRFTALLLDGLIIVGILLVLWVAIPATGLALQDILGAMSSVVIAAVVLLLTFAVVWGYFACFEGLRDGQTPGKRKMGLRVIRDGGYPVGFREALIRNLLRLIDSQPFPTWLVGGTVMMLHPQTKRLGDLVAGTVVVRERGETVLPEEHPGGDASGPPRLTDAEFDAVSRYAARSKQLPIEVRTRLSGQLLTRLADRLPSDARTGPYSAEVLLNGLYADEARRRAARGRVGGGTAQAAALVRERRGSWNDYRHVLERAGKQGLNGLPEGEVSRFAALYRATAADLARARTYGASPELLYSLERWVGAGHNLLYRPGARSVLHLFRWFAHGFPALVRRLWRPITLAAVLLFGPMAITGIAIHADVARARDLLPAQMLARAEEGAIRQAQGSGYIDMPELGMPLMASSIIANNVQVTFVAFVGGVLAGLGTLAILVLNGVSIGGVFGLFAAHGLTGYLLAFVLPHGVVELAAISIAGGAGLWMGSALVIPGRATRKDALVARGRDAVALIGGTAAMLLVAGIIEGFISPAPLPMAVKVGVSATTAVLLAVYLTFGGRAPSAADDQSSARAFTSR